MRKFIAGCAVALALSACGGSSQATGNQTGTSAPASASGPTVKLVDFALDPSMLTVHSGDTITVVNGGKAPHNLSVRDTAGKTIANTPNLQPGETAKLRVTFGPGSYVDYCSEPGHESLGMKGALTVS